MMNCLKEKMTQQNIALFLFVAFFWLYIAKMGIYNGIVIATTLWGIYFFVRHRQDVWKYFKESYFLYIFALLFVPIVISAVFSVLPKDSWKTVLNFSRFFFIGSLVILFSLSALNKIRYGVLAFIILISLDATIEWLTGYHLTGVSRDRVRIMGLFQFYHLGYVLATLTPIIFYQTIISFINKQKSTYFWLLISICSILAIFVAGARAGVITLLMSFGLIVLWLITQKKISLKIVMVSLVVLTVIGVGISQIPTVKNRYINPYQETEKVEIGSYE
ncbi:MAG: O-antigen ligase family protein, partial [Wohlfahrtiimonas sp.]